MNLTTPFTLPFCTPPHAYTPSRCSCQRCKKENQCPKLFSDDNNMDPGSVPAELQGLSQTEEMLIARCCPTMRAPTFSPWAHTSDDRYIYQLSLVLGTATVSFSVRNDLKYHSKQQAAASRPRICIASGSKPCLYTNSMHYSEAVCSAVSSVQ